MSSELEKTLRNLEIDEVVLEGLLEAESHMYPAGFLQEELERTRSEITELRATQPGVIRALPGGAFGVMPDFRSLMEGIREKRRLVKVKRADDEKKEEEDRPEQGPKKEEDN